jgi:peptide subunit release factor 1 (eRF1)
MVPNMFLIDLVLQEYRDLVICNNCLWAASLLKDAASVNFQLCPACGKGDLEIIPVADYESYKMSIDNKRGIEIEFVRKSNEP